MGIGDVETGRRIVEGMADVATALGRVTGSDSDVGALCDLVAHVLGGDHASIVVVGHGRSTTVAATDEVAERVEELKRDTAHRSCLSLGRGFATPRVDDLALESPWPDFGDRAVEDLGLHSLLAHGVRVSDSERVVVSVYARRASAFVPEHEPMIALLGAVVATTVRGVEHRRRADQLECALLTSRRIGAALGIIMATEDVDLDEAWDFLRRTSQDSNVRVAALAERVVRHGVYTRLEVLADAPAPDSSGPRW